jgi:hypothetical protein
VAAATSLLAKAPDDRSSCGGVDDGAEYDWGHPTALLW